MGKNKYQRLFLLMAVGLSLWLAACAGRNNDSGTQIPAPGVNKGTRAVSIQDRATISAKNPADPDSAYASRYHPLPSMPILIVNGTILTGTGEIINTGHILVEHGRIRFIGETLPATPVNTTVVQAGGKWITPGLIDAHSHLGDYPAPYVEAHADGNELTSPNTANVWAEHSIWPQDPQFTSALAGGITSLLVLPGSANLIGGRGVVLKNVPARGVAEMKFPGAPQALKMACGENPKRWHGSKHQRFPNTRMGNVAGMRAAFLDAKHYLNLNEKERAAIDGSKRLLLETLSAALQGEITIQIHCYRADEMAIMMAMAEEFGFHIDGFHHATEAYKIPDMLRHYGICAAMWPDWRGFNGIEENIALVHEAGACAIVHSDSAQLIQRLNQEAAKAMGAASRMGLTIPPAQAIMWITRNPARMIGIERQTGTLELGKMADIVIWDGDPFSIYSRPESVFIDGARVFDRNDPKRQPVSDFMVGVEAQGAFQ